MSTYRSQPGVSTDIGLSTLIFCLASCLLYIGTPLAHGFTITRLNAAQQANVRRQDIQQDGVGLGGGGQQVFNQGSVNRSLTTFSQSVDLNIDGIAPATMTGRERRNRFLRIRLTNAEVAQCLNENDFTVSYDVIGPTPDAFDAVDVGGGRLDVVNFISRFTSSNGGGGGCPRNIIFGYTLNLNIDDAVSSNTYLGNVEITVERIGPGGSTQTLVTPLLANLPRILLLYHHAQVNLDVQAAAIGSALNVAPTCAGDLCFDAGNRIIAVSSQPVVLDIAGDSPGFNALQTVTLRDAVGARALGCAGNIYSEASFEVLNTTGGIQPSTGTITNVDSQPCGFNLVTGDVAFDLDLNSVGTSTTASAVIRVTVVGL